MRFNIICEVPNEEAADFVAAMTGNDDDVLLVGEQAMRLRSSRAGGQDIYSNLELSFEDDESELKAALERAAGQRA